MKAIRAFLASSVALLVAQSQAHFVWAEYRAASQRQVVVYFAEGPNDSVLDSILPKINSRLTVVGNAKAVANTKLPMETTYPWLGTKGVFLGTVDYGVVNHGEGPYFLKYWYKAVSRPDQASKVVGKGLELVATQKSDHWDVSVYHNGKPCPEAEVIWIEDGNEKEASAKTPVAVPIPDAPKALPIRASLPTKVAGKFENKDYTLQKEWTTLVLPEVAKVTKGADESAYLALQNASMKREGILRGAFAFSCNFQATDGTNVGSGSVSVDTKGQVTVDTKGLNEGLTKHVTGQVKSLFSHRFGGQFWKGEGKNPITWINGSKDKIAVNDGMKSWYQIKNGNFTIVERTFGKNVLTLNIKSIVETPWGGVLSKEFTSTEKSAANGKVNSQLSYKDDFTPFLDEWMPKSRTVAGTVQDHKIKMSVTFSDYKLLP